MSIGKIYIEKYPGNIPIIVHYNSESKTATSQLLVPDNNTIANLLIAIRRSRKIPHSIRITLKIDNIEMDGKEILSNIYNKFKNTNDDCLHINVWKKIL